MTVFSRFTKVVLPALVLVFAGLPIAGHARDTGGINDPRAATNDAKVLFRAKCPGLFVPRVFESKYQGVVPGYAMYVVNKSDKRYTVKYDMLYTNRGDGVLLRGRKENLSSEKEFTIRPNTMMQFWLAKKVDSPYTV